VASNYEVNIKLNTRTVNKQLNNLEKRISKLNKLAQGGRANRTVLRNEQEKIKKTGQRLGLENKILKRKQDQVKVDKQALEVEKRRINLQNKPRGGGGGGGTGRPGGNRFATAGQSAIISGAFPLLFGQGPLIGAAGALGGGLGSLVGGQMGGFAGGLAATSIATPIQQLGIEAAKLGQALNPATKNVEALTAALGVTGTEFEKQIALLKKLGDEEAAFELARQKMINLIGKSGVDNMTKFGQEMTELGNNFTRVMTLMKNSMANFIQNSGILKLIAGTVERTAILGQAQASGRNLDTVEGRRINDLIGMRDKLTKNVGKDALSPNQKGQFALDVLGREKGKGLFGAANVQDLQDAKEFINDEIVALQKKINLKDNEAEAEAMIEAIQNSRVNNLDKEIAMLERSLTMSSEEFEIEQQIADMKEEGIIKDEEEIRKKLKKIQLLKEEAEEAKKVENLFKNIGQTIETGLVDAIEGAINGTKSLGEVASSVFSQIQRSLIQFGVNALLGSIGIPGFANGGRPAVGKPAIVGEKGPELFVPDRSGTIVPNNQLGGSTNVVVNVDATGSNVEGDEEQGRELGRLISAAVQSEIIQQQRPGGLLG